MQIMEPPVGAHQYDFFGPPSDALLGDLGGLEGGLEVLLLLSAIMHIECKFQGSITFYL